MTASVVARLLADPTSVETVADDAWTAIVCAARAERLLPALAHRLTGFDLPTGIASILQNARLDADAGRVQALHEAEMARRALVHFDLPVVLLKGTAFVAAGLDAGQGRLVGDLDILVPRGDLDMVEAALRKAGWDWVKPDAYDDAYYRRWMHELPPMIHGTRDRMIDVHHNVLPLTARPRPDAAALIADSEPLENGLRVLSGADMIVHAAAHMLADGDLSGGLRNLWDIDRLVRARVDAGLSVADVITAGHRHGLQVAVSRSLRLAHAIFVTPLGDATGTPAMRPRRADRVYRARLLARDGWGQLTRPWLRLAFYIRSHLIRMPLPMLLRHLSIKAWRAWG